MNQARRRVFTRVLALLLLAQVGLAATTWLFLDWGLRTWVHHRGQHLAATAVTLATRFPSRDIGAIPRGDTTSVAFTDCLTRLQKARQEAFPRGDVTLALFAVMPGPPRRWLSIRVADYPPYAPDDGGPPPPQSPHDGSCIEQVLAGKACSSPEPYGATEAGAPPVVSGYAPIRDEQGTVRAVLAVDASVAPLLTMQEASRTALLYALGPALLLSLLAATLLACRLVDPVDFLREVKQAALLGRGAGPVVDAGPAADPPEAAVPCAAGQPEATPTPVPAAPGVSPFLAAMDERWKHLSEREAEVVKYVGQALSPRDIAERMCVQESTVKQHLKNVYRELDIHSREELVVISVYKFGFQIDGHGTPE